MSLDKAYIMKKAGPLPVWAWMLIGLGLLLIYTGYKKSKSTGGTPTTSGFNNLPAGTQYNPNALTVIQEGYNPPAITVNNNGGVPAVSGRDASAYTGHTYTVQQGDTLDSIMKMFFNEKPGSTQAQIEAARLSVGNGLQWNTATQSYDLTPGQNLKLYSDAAVGVGDSTFHWPSGVSAPISRSNSVPVSPAVSTPRSVTVAPWNSSNPWNSTLSGIAQHYYNDASQYTRIAQANGIADPNLIYPGQQLAIP